MAKSLFQKRITALIAIFLVGIVGLVIRLIDGHFFIVLYKYMVIIFFLFTLNFFKNILILENYLIIYYI